jgi:dipeptidyl aminopeptidase/acylaminoacyl peptidase
MHRDCAVRRLFAAAVCLCLWCAPSLAQLRTATVRDGIELRALGDWEYLHGASSLRRVANFSPDGRSFALVLAKGDLKTMSRIFDLYVYGSDALRDEAPRALLHLAFSTTSNDPGLSELRWSSDSLHLTFIGADAGGITQVTRLDLSSQTVTVLTHARTNVIYYDQVSEEGPLVYVARAADKDLWTDTRALVGYRVTGYESLSDLIASKDGGSQVPEGLKIELHEQVQGNDRLIGLKHRLMWFDAVALSPDSRRLLITSRLDDFEFPESWKKYSGSVFSMLRKVATRPGYYASGIGMVEILDLATNQAEPLLNVPASTQPTRMLWIRHGAAVVLRSPRAAEEASNVNADEERIIEVELASRKVLDIGASCGVPIGWTESTSTLECLQRSHEPNVQHPWSGDEANALPDELPRAWYRRTNTGWMRTSKGNSSASDVFLFLRENFKMPPIIMAGDRKTGRRWEFLNLNPQLASISLAKVVEMSWKTTSGEVVKAGLFYPDEFRPGMRYPLVIQTHGWLPGRFEYEGMTGTGYEAQPLAARGMFVMQVDEVNYLYLETNAKKEIQHALDVYRSGITHLRDAGLIDDRRVGIIGWSHTCFEVKYALSHTGLFSVAALGEGEDGGYFQYLAGLNSFVDVATLYGGPPYGKNLSQWVDEAPGFNLDKVSAPLRIAVHSPRALLLDWEWFSGLSDLHKPVELIMLKDGNHFLEKPNEKLAVGEANLDWFDFWLNGHEDADKGKAEQYVRWEKLCDAQKSTNPGKPSFCRGSRH